MRHHNCLGLATVTGVLAKKLDERVSATLSVKAPLGNVLPRIRGELLCSLPREG
jgi:hypothetical protein